MSVNLMRNILLLVLLSFVLSGCASFGRTLSNFIRGKDSKDSAAEKTAHLTKFSDSENVRAPGSERQYKRMNRQRFEEEADIRSDAGSLWVMEGQGAYLFSQNRMRIVGDLLNVKIEGGPKSQLQTKVRVISRLLERLENPTRGLAPAQQPGQTPAGGTQAAGDAAKGKQPGQQGTPQAQGDGQATDGQAATPAPPAESKSEVPFAVQSVPTRVVEQLRDGSYRVRGMQPFMIGKREYKVIVTGIIRPEDFDDNGVEASRLLDPQFDIVSSRKGAM